MIFNIEQVELAFSNEDYKKYNFTQSYSQPPIVTATSAGGQNINVHVQEITTGYAVISLSAKFQGIIHLHVMSRTN